MWSWILWTVGTFGLGTTLIVVAGVIFGWPIIVGTKIGRFAILIGLAALGVVGVYFKGKSAGRAAERAKLKSLTGNSIGLTAAERRRIDTIPDSQVDSELSVLLGALTSFLPKGN